jgi:hydrogenase/urease accessory protein HupE
MLSQMLRRPLFTVLTILMLSSSLRAHQIAENALDVVIYPDKTVVDARISMEEVLAVEGDLQTRPPREIWSKLAVKHEPYVLAHLKIQSDGKSRSGKATTQPTITAPAAGLAQELSTANYRFEYPLPNPPQVIRIDQDLMREMSNWQCSVVVRIRRSDIAVFQSALLSGGRSIEFDCEWAKNPPTTSPTTSPSSNSSSAVGGSIVTEVKLWPTIQAYSEQGIRHILGGFDHLLFVSALVLAARGFWDLVKVVTAFTIAHTLTLTLSVLNIVTLSPRIVEPMIAASIVFVAVQNIFWPEQARGWSRLAIAFAFGLFHGLGFAGGLKQAMSEMPAVALGTALAAFSIGVEIGHQLVVIPLFVFLKFLRKSKLQNEPDLPGAAIMKFGSAAISLAGIYFLIQAIR